MTPGRKEEGRDLGNFQHPLIATIPFFVNGQPTQRCGRRRRRNTTRDLYNLLLSKVGHGHGRAAAVPVAAVVHGDGGFHTWTSLKL